MKYRPEIDGLRALAVVPVVLYHAGLESFSGGYVGVDVFFVISGFLITSLIVEEMNQGTFSLYNFYERRARRILPALLVVVVTCSPVVLLRYTPGDIYVYARSVGSILLFASNVLFWRETDYFDVAAETKPLLHTWSLGVEEQYYILFPVFVVLTWRLGRRFLGAAILFTLLASLALGCWGAHAKPTAAFYLLPFRGWEILLGATGALLQRSLDEIEVQRPARELLSALGLVFISTSIFTFDELTPVPSYPMLLPTVGTLLVLSFSRGEVFAGRLLRTRVVVVAGLMSYSIYLWHQPLLAFAKYEALGAPSTLGLAATLAGLVPVSYLSWRYVERPFRRKPSRDKPALGRYLLAFSILAPLSVALIGLKDSKAGVLDSRAESAARTQYATQLCDDDTSCDIDPRKLLIVGDSMWLDALNIIYTVHPVAYEVSQAGGCPPHDDILSLMNPDHPAKAACQRLNADRFRQDLSDIHAVAIIARYDWFRPEDLRPYLRYLKKNNIEKVLVFGSYFAVDTNMDRLINHYGSRTELISALEQKHLRHEDVADARFRQLQGEFGFTYISLLEAGCNADACSYFFDGKPFTYDVHHLTVAFSKAVATRNAERIGAFFDE